MDVSGKELNNIDKNVEDKDDSGSAGGNTSPSEWLYRNISLLVPDTPGPLHEFQVNNSVLDPSGHTGSEGSLVFNYSNHPLPGSNDTGGGSVSVEDIDPSPYSLGVAIVVGIILSSFIFFAVAGNLLVVVSVLLDRKLRKPTNYFIVSLAVADTLVGLSVMSFAVVNDIMGHWVFGERFCSIWISFDIMCCTSSILNLCAISLDRWVHIKNPFHYDEMMTSIRACLWVALIWALSILISFLPIQAGWHQIGLEKEEPDPNEPPPMFFICLLELNPIFALVSSMVSFYLPCLLMIVIYLKLFLFARQQAIAIKKTTCIPAHLQKSSKHKQKGGSDNKAAITLGVIMGTFLFCWVPFFTINLVAAFCPTCVPVIVFSVLTWLGYFNSTLNPIIYSIFNQEFRIAFKKTLSHLNCFKGVTFKRPVRFTSIPQKPYNSHYESNNSKHAKNNRNIKRLKVKSKDAVTAV